MDLRLFSLALSLLLFSLLAVVVAITGEWRRINWITNGCRTTAPLS